MNVLLPVSAMMSSSCVSRVTDHMTSWSQGIGSERSVREERWEMFFRTGRYGCGLRLKKTPEEEAVEGWRGRETCGRGQTQDKPSGRTSLQPRTADVKSAALKSHSLDMDGADS